MEKADRSYRSTAEIDSESREFSPDHKNINRS